MTPPFLQHARKWLAGNPVVRRLNRRLLMWFCVFSLVPLLVTNTIGYVESQRIIERLVYRYLHALAEVEARHVRDQVQRQELALTVIASGNEFLTAGANAMTGSKPASVRPRNECEECHNAAAMSGKLARMSKVASHDAVRTYLEKKLRSLDAFEALRLYGSDGHVLVTAARPGDRDIGVAGTNQAGFFVLPSTDPHRPPRFHAVVPLKREGVPPGYVAGVIGAAQLGAFLEIPTHLAGSVHSLIVDENARPLFASDTTAIIDYTRPHPISIQGGDRATHARYTDRFGTRLIASSAPVPGTSWTFVTEMPESAALGPLWTLRRTSAVFELIFVFLMAIAAWFVARSIVTPVRELVTATRRVADGDLTARVVASQQDELGELARTFNDMTVALANASESVRQLHQQQIERAQQLATVGELAAGVAHEIKNPVVGISNGLDLVQRRIGPDPVVEPIMGEMMRQIARIDSAVKDLLAFARPTRPTLAPVPGNQPVRRALRLIEPGAAKAGISISQDFAAEMPLVLLDEEQITQALVNVLVNATQATSHGGTISVATRVTPATVEFSISDTGRGITPEDLEHIYKPFFTTRHSGTGLGLSITRDTVEQHGGSIHVDSQVGRGTTFTISLPLTPAEELALEHEEVTV